MRKLSIDRFEGKYAICEDSEKKFFGIELSELPKEIKEGDVISISDDGIIGIDKEETNKRRTDTAKLQAKLWKN